MSLSGILVHNINDCLQTVADLFYWTQIEKDRDIIVWNLEAISYEPTVTRLYLRTKDVSLGSFPVHGYENATPRPLQQIPWLHPSGQGSGLPQNVFQMNLMSGISEIKLEICLQWHLDRTSEHRLSNQFTFISL